MTGRFEVAGVAADDQALAAVEVRLADGPWQPASGTDAWTATLDAGTAGPGQVMVTAQATDASGNTATHSITVDVSAPTDGQAPTISITSPTAGTTISGTVDITGLASDDVQLASVEVRVDAGARTTATGTSSWSHSLDTTSLGDGSHVIAARATDTTGNVAETAVTVLVQNGAGSTDGDWVLDDPRSSYGLLPLGRTHLAEWGDVTGVLVTEQFTNRRVMGFRDAVTGATSYVDLPTTSLAGWTSAATVMTSPSDLWVFGGNGPMLVRHYALSGSPLPTSATLVEQRSFGDADSREGDMIALDGGGLVLTWHQQGQSGPQGLHIAHRSAAGQWQELPALSFMPTMASDQVLGQHPADGSIWLFNNPDGWGAIGAVHLSDTGAGLRIDWTDSTFLSSTEHGLDGPDPENPNLALDVDDQLGTLTLAYQSADRQRFSDGTTWKIGSRVALATIEASGAVSFLTLAVWAERVSAIGLVARGGERVVSYTPVDETTLRSDEIHVRRFRAGAWEPATVLGTLDSTDRVTYGSSRAEFATRLDDGRIHLRTV